MSESEFENYVAIISKLLQLQRSEEELIAEELQDHLQLRVRDLECDGMTKPEAVRKALEEFGDAAVMAKNFQAVLKLKKKRWMMRFATFSVLGTFFLAVLAMAIWPEDARFGAPSQAVATQETDGEAGIADDPGTEASFESNLLSETTKRNMATEAKLEETVAIKFVDT
ncbi:MAG: permease prefix domain 1-containing protein, partial [Planctomycetota bacterium]